MIIVYLFVCLLVATSAFADAPETIPVQQFSVNDSVNAPVIILSDSCKQKPVILHPDFYHKHMSPHGEGGLIPSIPADPNADPLMPRMRIDPQVDAKIIKVYPHVGHGLLKLEKSVPHGRSELQDK